MLIEIDANGGVPIYRQVIDQVRQLIMTGQLQTGDQLESVKKLAGRLKVNPMTISKAYGYLVHEGLVERQRGIGLFVMLMPVKKTAQLKKDLLADALKNAAALAVQMDVSDKEASLLFATHLKTYRDRKGSSDNEF